MSIFFSKIQDSASRLRYGGISLCASLLMAAFLMVPLQHVCAAELFFKVAPDPSLNASVLVDVRLDPQKNVINVVEGVLHLRAGAQGVLENDTLSGVGVTFNTDGSVLTLWPVAPEYNPAEKTIHFTGGVPGGFVSEGSLFRIALSAPTTTTFSLQWAGGTAYLNDGKGTKENITARSVTFNADTVVSDEVISIRKRGVGGIIMTLLGLGFVIVLIYFFWRHTKRITK